jgi:1-phosphatidylinositol-3-phosphate 5-kinase
MDGIMYPRNILRERPKAIRFESNISIHSSNTDRRIEEEDAIGPDWNTITGVTAESERNKPNSVMPDQRPTSIMKTITNLWTGNPANFLPLKYPSHPGEHIFPDSIIIVREDEPSSIISFALCSNHYQEKLRSIRNNTDKSDTTRETKDDGKFSIDFDDNQAGIEETLLKDSGTHILYRSDFLT